MYWQYFEDLDKIEKGEEQILNLSKKILLVNEQDVTAKLEEVLYRCCLSMSIKMVFLIIKALVM